MRCFMELIRVKDVQKTYRNGVVALYDFSVNIPKGDFVFVIGASGSGKSTFIKMLYREEKPDKGSIYIGGIDVARLKNRKVYKLRRKLGVVFQDFKLLPKSERYILYLKLILLNVLIFIQKSTIFDRMQCEYIQLKNKKRI